MLIIPPPARKEVPPTLADVSKAVVAAVEKKFSTVQIPPGDKGDPGDRGDAGLKGDPGAPGISGEKGLKGDRGDVGLKGDPGDKGDRGDVGLKGDRGDAGLKGDPGARGPRGPQGDKGDPGDQGPPGVGIDTRATILTLDDETNELPGSLQLEAGGGIMLDARSRPGKVLISSFASGGAIFGGGTTAGGGGGASIAYLIQDAASQHYVDADFESGHTIIGVRYDSGAEVYLPLSLSEEKIIVVKDERGGGVTVFPY